MKTIAISEFKAKCIGILRRAQNTGEPVVVTRRGQPIVRIEPLPQTDSASRLGRLRGRLRLETDLVAEETTGDWEMLD